MGGFWKRTPRDAELKVWGWLPSLHGGTLLPAGCPPPTCSPSLFPEVEHPTASSATSPYGPLVPSWEQWLGLVSWASIKLPGLGVSVCRWIVPQAHLPEALLMLLTDSLLRTQNTLPLGPDVHSRPFWVLLYWMFDWCPVGISVGSFLLDCPQWAAFTGMGHVSVFPFKCCALLISWNRFCQHPQPGQCCPAHPSARGRGGGATSSFQVRVLLLAHPLAT